MRTQETMAILNGNEIIVQGALEAGFQLYTGYPGSPLADFFTILHRRKEELRTKGIRVVIANSEANAAAMAGGAKQAGRDTLVAMKSMGLHVASDALSVGNFANPGPVFTGQERGESLYPGVVIVVGDDPWSLSTSTPADSRYLFKHLHIPFLEPATPEELKDWIKISLEISKRSSVYQGIILTTFMAEGGGRVSVGEEKKFSTQLEHIDPASFDLSKNVMVPPNSLLADRRMIEERFPRVLEVMAAMKLDKIFGPSEAKIGIITSGVTFEIVKQIFTESGLDQVSALYKVASSYPLIEENILGFLKGLDHLIVIEEKRGFLEEEVGYLCAKNSLSVEILGKIFRRQEGFPSHGGLSYEIIQEKLREVLALLAIPFCSSANKFLVVESLLPKRLPTFCPGCPHRETLSLLKDLRSELKSKGIDLIGHGDVGCYSLSFLPPFREMHNLSAMGQGGALGSGLDLFTSNPSVALMGDSTFFHSGVTDISHSVQSAHQITYILLDNGNTAMTGHQMTPVSGENVEGTARPRQSILEVVKALGVSEAHEVNPSDRYFYKNLLSEIIQRPGTKVIVSNKECGLTYHARKKAQDKAIFAQGKSIPLQRFYQINTDVCEDCRECVENTGCPGLTRIEDAYGSKVAIDHQICVSDGYCASLKACPSFELVEVLDFNPGANRQKIEFEGELPLPEAIKKLEDMAQGKEWRMTITGVGGTGVTTISRIISQAAANMSGRDDLDFKFMDQKGLAQRNGNVTGHLSIFKKGLSRGPVTPVGAADLLVSPDLFDGSSHLAFLSLEGVLIIDEEFQYSVSSMLEREGAAPMLSGAQLLQELKLLLLDRLFSFSLKKVSNAVFDKSVYTSAMILGISFQLGRLPFSLEDLHQAFAKSLPANEFSSNWSAFTIGREFILKGEKWVYQKYLPATSSREGSSLVEKSIIESLLPWHNRKRIFDKYHTALGQLSSEITAIPSDFFVSYLHDLFIYDRGEWVEDFVKNALALRQLYSDPQCLLLAVRTLAKTYFVKDEVFIAHQMISPLANERDKNYYGKRGKSFRKIFINRPRFEVGIFGKLEFDLHPRVWMLKVMRHGRALRRWAPFWHQREREMALEIRSRLLRGPIQGQDTEHTWRELKKWENIKGYREVRYAQLDLAKSADKDFTK